MPTRTTLLIAVAAAALAIVPSALAEGRLAGSAEPDAVAYFYANERATLTAQPLGGDAVVRRGDDFLRTRPVISPASTPAVSQNTGSDIKWAQLGIGVGLGILLAAGLGLAIRVTKHRQFAH